MPTPRPGPVPLSRREFTHSTGALAALLLAGGFRPSLFAAEVPVSDEELRRQLLGHCLARQLRGQYDRSLQAMRLMAHLNAGATTTLQDAARMPDAVARRFVTRLGREMQQAAGGREILAGASDLLALAHVRPEARAALLRSGVVDQVTRQLMRFTAGKIEGAPAFRDALLAVQGIADALPALARRTDPAALLSLASPLIQAIHQRAGALAGKSLAEVREELQDLAERNLLGGAESLRRQPELERAAQIHSRLAEAQQAVQLLGPVLTRLGMAPAAVSQLQSAANFGLTLALVCAGGPLTMTGALSLLGATNGLLGDGGGGASATEAALERMQQTLEHILSRLQRIEENQARMMEMLARFEEESRQRQGEILNTVQAFGDSIEAKIDVLITAERQRLWTEFRRQAEQTLGRLRLAADPATAVPGAGLASLVDFCATIRTYGQDVPMMDAMSVAGDGFGSDAAKLLTPQPANLALYTRCEFLAPLPAFFDYDLLRADTDGSRINPVVWLQYASHFADVALEADATQILPLASAQARALYEEPLRVLEESGRSAARWFALVGSGRLTAAIARRVTELVGREDAFLWVERALRETTTMRFHPGYESSPVNPATVFGDFYREGADWRLVKDSPLIAADNFGVFRLMLVETRNTPESFPVSTGQFAGGLAGNLVMVPAPRKIHVHRLALGPGALTLGGLNPHLVRADDPFWFLNLTAELHLYEAGGQAKRFWTFRAPDGQAVPASQVLPLFEVLVRQQELSRLAPLIRTLLETTARALTDTHGEKSRLIEWMRHSMLGNFCHAVRLWRQGVYGSQGLLQRGGAAAGAAFGAATPFPYGHEGDLLFSPAELAALCAEALEAGGYHEPDRHYYLAGERLDATTIPQFARAALRAALTARIAAYQEIQAALTDPDSVSIPPLELGLAKLAAVRSALAAT
jgi:hypothetical protein